MNENISISRDTRKTTALNQYLENKIKKETKQIKKIFEGTKNSTKKAVKKLKQTQIEEKVFGSCARRYNQNAPSGARSNGTKAWQKHANQNTGYYGTIMKEKKEQS